jgi:hypothetical protein
MARGTQKTDIQLDNITLSSPKTTNNLSELLTGSEYSLLLERLHEDGIFTIDQYRQKFIRNGLMRYLNANDLYAWQQRVKIVEGVSSILRGLEAENKNPPLNPLDSTIFNQDGGIKVDFESDVNYQYSFPIKVVFGGVDQVVNNWTDFLVQLCECMIVNHPAEMLSLISSPLFPGSSHP